MGTQYKELMQKYKFKNLTNYQFNLIYLISEGYRQTGFQGIWTRNGKNYEVRFVGDNLEMIPCSK